MENKDDISNPKNNQIVVDETDDTLYRYDISGDGNG